MTGTAFTRPFESLRDRAGGILMHGRDWRGGRKPVPAGVRSATRGMEPKGGTPESASKMASLPFLRPGFLAKTRKFIRGHLTRPPWRYLFAEKNGKCSFGTLVFCRKKRRKKKKKLELGKGTCYAVGTVAELFYLAHEVYVQKLGLYVCTCF